MTTDMIDENFHDTRAKILQRLGVGEGTEPIVGGESGETRVVSFRVDNYLDMMIRKGTELTFPRCPDRSTFIRTILTLGLECFWDVQDEPNIRRIMASIELEREMNDEIAESRAQAELTDRLRNLGDVVMKHERNGELEIAVRLVLRQIRRIEKEPDKVRQKRHLRMFSDQENIRLVMRRASLDGVAGADRALDFIDNQSTA